nr:zinc finger protein KNUCKLES-like [Aegilops tauschii subsp. strangulata]
MESSGSSVSTFPADNDKSLPLATRAEDDKAGHTSHTSSLTASSTSSNEVQKARFKCEYCPRTFTTVQGRSGHQTVHRHLWAPLGPVNKKARIDRPPASSSARIWASSVDTTALGRAYLHENLFAAHYYPSAPFVPPSLQTGTGLAPTQPSPSLSVRVAGGYRGTGDGGHRGHQQGVREVDQEETADGIDLTLRL